GARSSSSAISQLLPGAYRTHPHLSLRRDTGIVADSDLKGKAVWDWCARKGCQAAKGSASRRAHKTGHSPLSQAARALAVCGAPATVHGAPEHFRGWVMICLHPLSMVPLTIMYSAARKRS